MKINFEFGAVTREHEFSKSLPLRTRKRVWTQIRVVSFRAERFIKIRMPVDTGRARASWGHSSAPAAPDEGIWEEKEGALELTQGSRVEYIEALNEGHSKQAPAGFIDAEERRAMEDLANAVGGELDEVWS